MPSMKYNLISIMRAGAEALDQVGDECGRAYALHEAANNMILLLNGTDTVEDLLTCYTAGNAEPLDLEARFPPDEMDEWDGEGACPKCQGDGCDPESGCIHDV